jgi:hypothetical protein
MLTPLASHFLAGSILTLVLPVAVVIAMLAWYWIVWRRGTEERAAGAKAAPGDLPPVGAHAGAGDGPPTHTRGSDSPPAP